MTPLNKLYFLRGSQKPIDPQEWLGGAYEVEVARICSYVFYVLHKNV